MKFLQVTLFVLLSIAVTANAKNNDKKLIDKVIQWQIANINQVDTFPDTHWTRAALYRGMVEWAEYTQSKSLYNHLYKVGEKNNWDMRPRIYDADDLCICQTYLKLYYKYKEPRMIEKCIARLDAVIANPMTLPLSDAPAGKYNRDRWGWCDALYMAPPVYAQISLLKNNPKYLNYAVSEFKVTTDSLYNKDDQLFYRDLRWVGRMEESGKKMYWGRGNGWVIAGLAFMLQYTPETDPSYQYFLTLFTEMSEAILNCQDENGSWHTSMMDATSYPEPENSASGFFVYGLAWGVNNGILKDAKYKDGAKKAWEALKKYVNKDGKLGYVQPIGHAPFKNLTADHTHVYGVGAFLLAGTEICRMSEL
jgi:rhamnogalacturonyl hydrolase YesR